MAHRALEAVQDRELRIDPAIFEETWYSWLHDVRFVTMQYHWSELQHDFFY
jgi:hypothetical protein